MRRYAKRRKTLPQRIPEKFGDLVNADHLLAQSPESMGLFGERDVLLIVDIYSLRRRLSVEKQVRQGRPLGIQRILRQRLSEGCVRMER